MATVMNQHRPRQLSSHTTTTQKVCIGMGVLFILLGLIGIIMPGFLGMHLSLIHDFIHLASGALALWCGYAESTTKAYNFSLGFGVFYGLLGLSGLLFGEPGYPGVGHMEADESLLRIIPNVLEFGTVDHTIHVFISGVFLTTAYLSKRKHKDKSVSRDKAAFTDYPGEAPNSKSGLKDAELGRSDIQRRSDIKRHSDFENRI
jgi:hypothetical protein